MEKLWKITPRGAEQSPSKIKTPEYETDTEKGVYRERSMHFDKEQR